MRRSLVLFHAYGDSAAALEGTAGRLARATGLRSVLVDGPVVLDDGGRAWTSYESDDPRQIARMRRRLLRRLQNERPLGLFGFSQGGMIALELALATPLPVEAVVAVGAFLAPAGLARPRARIARKPMPRVLLIHGRDDDAVSPKESERALERARSVGCDARLRLLAGGHEVTRGAERAAAAFLRVRLR